MVKVVGGIECNVRRAHVAVSCWWVKMGSLYSAIRWMRDVVGEGSVCVSNVCVCVQVSRLLV